MAVAVGCPQVCEQDLVIFIRVLIDPFPLAILCIACGSMIVSARFGHEWTLGVDQLLV